MKEVAPILEKLAAKLGVTVEYLWPFLVEKTRIDWIASTSISLTVLATGLLCLYKAFKLYETAPTITYRHEIGDYKELSPLNITLFIVGGVSSFFGFFFSVMHLAHISAFLAPEATTIMNLLRMTSGG